MTAPWACCLAWTLSLLPPVLAQRYPLMDRAESLRAELAARQMIAGQDAELGAARSIAIMTRNFRGAFEDSFNRCGLRSVEDTPVHVKPGAVNTFAVSFRNHGKEPCAELKDRAACEYLQNNCITLGTSIFCDYDYLLLLRNLARASYAYTYLALTSQARGKIETLKLLPWSPDLLTDFASFQVGGQMSPSVRGAVGLTQKYSSVLAESAEFAVLGAVIGHELSHVESNACPDEQRFTKASNALDSAASLGIRLHTPQAAENMARKYRERTCHGTLSQAELTADLRGIEMLGTMLWVQFTLSKLGYSGADKQGPAAELWRLKGGVAAIALAQALEYELIVASDPAGSIADIRTEPKEMDNSGMFRTYSQLGYNRTRQQLLSPGARGEKHMYPSYRAGLLLQTVGLPALYEQRRALGIKISFPIRLFGYIEGSLRSMQTLGCSTDPKQAARNALAFLYETSGALVGEFLVD